MGVLEDSKIRFNTLIVTVVACFSLTTATAAFAWKASNTLTKIDNELKAQSAAISEVKENSYTLSRAAEQALRMAIENPGMRVPDPRDPSKLIVVHQGAIDK